MLFRGITSQCANRDLVEGNICFSLHLCTMQTKRLFHKLKKAWCFLFSFQKSHVESVTSGCQMVLWIVYTNELFVFTEHSFENRFSMFILILKSSLK